MKIVRKWLYRLLATRSAPVTDEDRAWAMRELERGLIDEND